MITLKSWFSNRTVTVHHSEFTLLLSDSSGYRILEILNHSTPSLKGSALKDDIMDVSL